MPAHDGACTLSLSRAEESLSRAEESGAVHLVIPGDDSMSTPSMMGLAVDEYPGLPATPWGELPPRIKALFIAGDRRPPGWLSAALGADSATELSVVEVRGIAAGLSCLRDEAFDVVLICHGVGLDACELLDAIRAGSCDEQPIVVLGDDSDQDLASLCHEAGADAYCCIRTTTIRGLIWNIARATERHQLIAENRRLHQAHRHRMQLERSEAMRQWDQQWSVLGPVVNPDVATQVEREQQLPDSLVHHYREILQAYVIRGTGHLAGELREMIGGLVQANVTPQRTIQLHLTVLGSLLTQLGSRSARHVMHRADTLALEILVGLASAYRQQSWQATHPARQTWLPGFDS